MTLYPVMLNISDRRAVVIGGGTVALRKIEDLVSCGASVTVIAPDIHESIHAIREANPGTVSIERRPYRRGDCDGAHIVFAASGDEKVNREVFLEADEKNIFINAVDDPPNCTFFVPSWFNRDGLVVSVSTSGASPSLAAKIRREIEKIIPDSIGETLAAMKAVRSMLRDDGDFRELSSHRRGLLLKRIADDGDLLAGLVRSRNEGSLKDFIKKLLETE